MDERTIVPSDFCYKKHCRTIVPSEYFDKHIDTTKPIEIDRTKVFTWAFAQIKFIPGFYSWKHYSDDIDISKLSSFTLYTVEVKASNVFSIRGIT